MSRAAAGLATFAVGVSLTPTINNKGLGITASVILASGTGILAGVLIAASARGFRMAGSAIAGLILRARDLSVPQSWPACTTDPMPQPIG